MQTKITFYQRKKYLHKKTDLQDERHLPFIKRLVPLV